MIEPKKKVIIAVTGASGTIYAIDLIKKLQKNPNVETHGVFSAWAKKNLQLETDYSLAQLNAMLDYSYNDHDLGAKIASGSFLVDAMVIVPASMKTIASISVGLGDNLISRAADVTLKERRQLIMVARETPLSTIHLENMTKLSQMGVEMIPPIPAFYNHPETIQDLVSHQTMKLLDALHIHNDSTGRWEGI